jgi:hypothetical protein
MTQTDPAASIPADAGGRAVLRHLTATLAYRAAKVLRDAPAEFGAATFGTATRQPVQILAHLADLMAWAVSLTRGEHVWSPAGSRDWSAEVTRFYDGLARLDAGLAGELPAGASEKLVQGPLADALTHVGQLAMLRGMAGAPVRPEGYAGAPIAAGRIGLDQAPPRTEFDGDASAT